MNNDNKKTQLTSKLTHFITVNVYKFQKHLTNFIPFISSNISILLLYNKFKVNRAFSGFTHE